MIKLMLISLVFLVSCSSSKDVKGPDGSLHKLVECNEIEDCYKEAAKVCGKYKIVNTSSHQNPVNNGNGGGTYSKLLVKCEG